MNGQSTFTNPSAVLAAWSCMLAAGIAGCAGVSTPESQLFGERATCRSAAIAYRVEHGGARRNEPRSAVAKLLDPADAGREAERRVMTLAVRYPHPAGRAGYARVECITTRAPGAGEDAAASGGWLRRLGRMADDTLPGLKMADGVYEALGMDVPIGELDGVLAQLQSTAGRSTAGGPAAELSCTIDEVALPVRRVRVAELDRLVARVRQNGRMISHTSSSIEPLVGGAAVAQTTAATPAPAAAPAVYRDAGVVPASYAEPATSRLPPVDSIWPRP